MRGPLNVLANRSPEAKARGLVTASAGNLRAYLQSGMMIRLGQGLQADYGPARLRPGVTGGDHEGGVIEGLFGEGAGFEFGRTLRATSFVQDPPVAIVLRAGDEDRFDELFLPKTAGRLDDPRVIAFREDNFSSRVEGSNLCSLLLEESLRGGGYAHRVFSL